MPDMVEDHCPSNYTARVPAKVLQQSELLRGKLEDAITPLCFAPNKIKLEIGNFQPQRFLLWRGAICAVNFVTSPRVPQAQTAW